MTLSRLYRGGFVFGNKGWVNFGPLSAPARTAIVNALSLGIPPSVVMKWTGHSDYNAMKPYIDIVDSIKAESMTKFNNLL